MGIVSDQLEEDMEDIFDVLKERDEAFALLERWLQVSDKTPTVDVIRLESETRTLLKM